MSLNYSGNAACNEIAGPYFFNPQLSFTLYFASITLSECETLDEVSFDNIYSYYLLNSNHSTEFEYEINGTGDDASLIITNLSNGNKGFYDRQALSTDKNVFNSLKISLNSNPVSNSLDLSTTQDLIGANYEILSITGQLSLKGILNANIISVVNYSLVCTS